MKIAVSKSDRLHPSWRGLRSLALPVILCFAIAGTLRAFVIYGRMFGIAVGQTARVNLVNIGDPHISTATTCGAALQFVDSSGHVLKRFAITDLAPGQATSFDLDRREIPNTTTNRVQIRALGNVTIGNPNIIPPGPCRLSLEVFDNFTGRTSVWIPILADPPEPDSPAGFLQP